MFGDSKKQFVPSRMICYTPPAFASEEELTFEQMKNLRAVVQKLDSIEKELQELKNNSANKMGQKQ